MTTASQNTTEEKKESKEEKFINAQQDLRITREVVTHSSSVKNKKLLEAVQQGDLKSMKYWLQQGADINTCEGDENKINVLQWAIRKSYREVVAFLLTQSGVNLAYQDGYGLGMLQTAITVQSHYDATIVTLLEKKGLVLMEPYSSAMRGYYNSLATLKTQRVDLSKADKAGGFTVLHYAAARGQLQTVQWIVTNIPNIVNVGLAVSKDTALLLAAYNGHTATVEWLLTKGGARITEVNKDGTTALLLAAYNGHTATVEWLITKGGAKVAEASNFGNTALLLAAVNGHTATVEWLLTKGGAKVVEANKDGDTALLLAALNGYTATVEWLLTKGGAKIAEANKSGNTALLRAAYEAVEWLLRKGGAAITEIKEVNRKTISAAQERNKKDTAEFLEKWEKSLKENNIPPTLTIEIYQTAAAASNNEPYAQYKVGCCYEQKQDFGKAIEWYQKASASNYMPALKAIDEARERERLLAGIRSNACSSVNLSAQGLESKSESEAKFVDYTENSLLVVIEMLSSNTSVRTLNLSGNKSITDKVMLKLCNILTPNQSNNYNRTIEIVDLRDTKVSREKMKELYSVALERKPILAAIQHNYDSELEVMRRLLAVTLEKDILQKKLEQEQKEHEDERRLKIAAEAKVAALENLRVDPEALVKAIAEKNLTKVLQYIEVGANPKNISFLFVAEAKELASNREELRSKGAIFTLDDLINIRVDEIMGFGKKAKRCCNHLIQVIDEVLAGWKEDKLDDGSFLKASMDQKAIKKLGMLYEAKSFKISLENSMDEAKNYKKARVQMWKDGVQDMNFTTSERELLETFFVGEMIKYYDENFNQELEFSRLLNCYETELIIEALKKCDISVPQILKKHYEAKCKDIYQLQHNTAADPDFFEKFLRASSEEIRKIIKYEHLSKQMSNNEIIELMQDAKSEDIVDLRKYQDKLNEQIFRKLIKQYKDDTLDLDLKTLVEERLERFGNELLAEEVTHYLAPTIFRLWKADSFSIEDQTYLFNEFTAELRMLKNKLNSNCEELKETVSIGKNRHILMPPAMNNASLSTSEDSRSNSSGNHKLE